MSKTKLNKAKNTFLKWLKAKKAECIDEFEGTPCTEWQYYRSVSGFIDSNLYTVYFMMWQDTIRIDYSDGENKYKDLSISEFLELINC